MKKTLLSFFLVSLASFAFSQDQTALEKNEIVFKDISIISMEDDGVIEHQTLVARNGRIVDIGPVQKVKYSKAAYVVDGRGKFLIPGLAEMHAHVPPIDNIEPMKEVVALFAVNGITTIRGMLGHPKHLELRTMIRNGEILAPHFYTTGPSINGMSVTSPEAGAEMVRQQKKAGYDFLKMHPGLSRAKFDSIAATAKKVGIPFVGHVSFGVGVWRAIEAGYSSIDHLDGFIEGLVPGIEKMVEQETGPFGMQVAMQADTTQIPRLMSALKSHNIWVVPTQSLGERWFSPHFTNEDFEKDPHKKYMSPQVVQQWTTSKTNLLNDPDYNVSKAEYFVALRRKLIAACQKNGIGILLGCDAPQVFNVPGFSTHNELAYLVKSGLTPYQALQAGTTNVARYFNLTDSGKLKPGFISDIVMLNGNPLSDITQTQNISGVLIGKKWMDRPFIDAKLKSLEK